MTDSGLVSGSLILKIDEPSFSCFFLLLNENEGCFDRWRSGCFLCVQIRVCLFFHMMQNFLVKLFEASPQFLVLFPNLLFIQLAIICNFSHMLISLCIADGVRSTDIWQIGTPSRVTIIRKCPSCLHITQFYQQIYIKQLSIMVNKPTTTVMLLNLAILFEVSSVLIPNKKFTIMKDPLYMDVSPSGQHIAVANLNEYQIFSYAKSEMIDTFNDTYFSYSTIALHPNEKQLYLGEVCPPYYPRMLSQNYNKYQSNQNLQMNSEKVSPETSNPSVDDDFTKDIIFINDSIIYFNSRVMQLRRYTYFDGKYEIPEGNMTTGEKISDYRTQFVVAQQNLNQTGLSLAFYDWSEPGNISFFHEYRVQEGLNHIYDIKFNKKEHLLYIVGDSGTIFAYDLYSNTLEPFTEVQAKQLLSIDVSDDGKTIAVATQNNIFLLQAIPEGQEDEDEDDEGVESNTTGFRVTKMASNLGVVKISRDGDTVFFVNSQGTIETMNFCDEQPNLKCDDGTEDCLEYAGKQLCMQCKKNYYQENNICYKQGTQFPTQILIAFAIIGLIVIVVIFITVVNSKRERSNPLLQEDNGDQQ